MESRVKPQPGAESFVSRHHFVLVFGALLAFYVLTPIVQQLRPGLHPAVPPAVEAGLFLTLLLGTIVAVSKRRALTLFAMLLAVAAGVLWLVGIVIDIDGVHVVRYVLLVGFLSYVIWVMLRAIFDSRQVTFDTLCASLCIYLLLGLVWAPAYSAVDLLDPAAFTCTVETAKPRGWLRLGRGETAVLYFSFATLTTLGYGDIVPTSPISRMLASIEAIAGQLYLTVLVARLVGMHIAHSIGRQQARDREPGDGR
jgi:hypothetical protein